MKFNKLAKELNLSVSDLAEKAKDILPNANGGTEVSDEQKAQIEALLRSPTSENALSFTEDGSDPILSVLLERIDQEEQLATPEQVVDEMISRYVENPEDLPTDPEYREAIALYVDLVKKRHARRQQQSSRLRSHLNKSATGCGASKSLALESFYGDAPATNEQNAKLNGNSTSPQLAAASS